MNRCAKIGNRPAPSGQRGVVLVISLIILLIMTLVGVTAMQTTTLEERMAGHLRDSTLAFEAAEAALREAGEEIDRWFEAPRVGVTAGFLGKDAPVAPTVVKLSADGVALAELGTGLGVTGDPIYVIRELGFIPDDLSAESLAKQIGTHRYAVTTLAVGSTPQSRSMLQSVVTKRFR